MAGTAIATEHIFSRLGISMHDHDPGATTAVILSSDGGTTPVVVDMRDWGQLAFLATPTAGTTPSITKLEILGAELPTMANPEVIKESGTLAADAPLIDYVGIEMAVEEMAQIGSDTGKNLRYAALRLTQAGNADNEAIVVTIRAKPRYPRSGLTANNIS